jgi:hypothetical protein
MANNGNDFIDMTIKSEKYFAGQAAAILIDMLLLGNVLDYRCSLSSGSSVEEKLRRILVKLGIF